MADDQPHQHPLASSSEDHDDHETDVNEDVHAGFQQNVQTELEGSSMVNEELNQDHHKSSFVIDKPNEKINSPSYRLTQDLSHPP